MRKDFAYRQSDFCEKQTNKSAQIISAMNDLADSLQAENERINFQLEEIAAYQMKLREICQGLCDQHTQNDQFLESYRQACNPAE